MLCPIYIDVNAFDGMFNGTLSDALGLINNNAASKNFTQYIVRTLCMCTTCVVLEAQNTHTSCLQLSVTKDLVASVSSAQRQTHEFALQRYLCRRSAAAV